MEIKIWYQHEKGKPEVVDRANSEQEANYLLHEYKMAFGLLPGQCRYGKDKLWKGRRKDCDATIS